MKSVLAGCGNISRKWLSFLKENEYCDLLCLVDIDKNSAKALKHEFQLNIDISDNFTEALHQYKPQIVFDCTVPTARFEICSSALQSGAHVFSEKPIADNMEQAKKLVELAQVNHQVFAVMQNRRFDPNIRSIKEYLDQGILGEITTINCDFYLGPHFGGFRDTMKNVLLKDMAIHTFDAARYLSDANPVHVYCHEWNPKGSWYQHGASAVAVYGMENGIIYTYRGSWCYEGQPTHWEGRWQIIGTRGSLDWDGAEHAQVTVLKGNAGFFYDKEVIPGPSLIPPEPENWHSYAIESFCKSIQQGSEPENVAHENIKSFLMVESAIQSADQKNLVNIN